MDSITRTNLDNLRCLEDGDRRYAAFLAIMAETEKPVDWAYDVWDDMVADLRHKDPHRRAIAAQLLANLAKSDPEQRILRDFDALFAVTRDAKFVTARHCLQSIWKVGAAGKPQQKRVVDAMDMRFRECSTEKNCTLIRYDIIEGLRKLYDEGKDEAIRTKALELIDLEQDPKYRTKYASLWRAK